MEPKQEIKKLARDVFDYEEWNLFISSDGSVHLAPSGNQRATMHWPNSQSCIDDLRFRRLVRFTPFAAAADDGEA